MKIWTHFKKHPILRILGILIGIMLILPLLLRLDLLHVCLVNYLQPLGTLRAQFLTVFATIISSFIAVASSIVIQEQARVSQEKSEREQQKSRCAANIIKLCNFIVAIKSAKNGAPKNGAPLEIEINNWRSYLSSIDLILSGRKTKDYYDSLETLFQEVDKYNQYVARGEDNAATIAVLVNIDESLIEKCDEAMKIANNYINGII